MKTTRNFLKAFLLLNLFFLSNLCLAQANEGFTYQAVIRNSGGTLVTNAAVGVRISLLQNSASGSVLFSERHTATTNANGLVTFVISNGTLLSGSFSAIDWANSIVFLKTDTDPTGGTNYTITNTSQLKSVPFANFANEAGNTWKPSGNVVGSTEFIGSTNNADVNFKRNNTKAGLIGVTNTAFGTATLPNNTSVSNSAFGAFSLGQNSGGFGNVGFGYESLRVNNGNYNSAIGHSSLALATGDQNTALGWRALDLLTTGGGNIAIGRITNVPSPTANDQLSIGNVIYGSAMGNTANGKIGIGVPVPTEKLEVAGKTKTTNLQVTAGAGLNKVLTSDATGNATWQNPNVNTGLHRSKNAVFGLQSISNNLYTKVTFPAPQTDDASAYNAITNEWIIPSTGFYHIYATTSFFDAMPSDTEINIAIYVNGFAEILQTQRANGGTSENMSITANIKLNAGQAISIYVRQTSGTSKNLSNLQLSNFLSGYKIY